MSYVYVTIEQAVALQQKTVNISGGGDHGAIDIGKLASVLDNIQNDEYYPTLVGKLTHLFYCTNQFHCFVDGNKRLSVAVCGLMLLQNGYLLCLHKYFQEAENISYHVARGAIQKPLLHECLNAILTDKMDQLEELKLSILLAIEPTIDTLEFKQHVEVEIVRGE